MSAQTTTVGSLTAQDIGRYITLEGAMIEDGSTRTYTDRIIEVRHLPEHTYVETDIHWEGEWPHDHSCTLSDEAPTSETDEEVAR